MGFVSILSYVVLFLVGMEFVFSGRISVGDFVAMQGLILLIQVPLLELGYVISDWKKSTTSLKRLYDIYSNDKDENLISPVPVSSNKHSTTELNDVYHIDSLNFSYRDQDSHKEAEQLSERSPVNQRHQQVLSDLSLNVHKGQRLGITGPIGSGKSTFIKILAGLERDFTGELKFLGQNFFFWLFFCRLTAKGS